MPKIYRVRLEASERRSLEAILKRDKCAAHKQRHARILLKADENAPTGALKDTEIAGAVEVGTATVHRVRRIFVEHGLERALERKDPDRVYERKLDAKGEAKLVALACEGPPEGRSKWTMQLLADKLIELEVVGSIGREAVRTTLKKNEVKPWQKRQWCVKVRANPAEFVCRMEEVLDLYALPRDPRRPLVCIDEATKQLVKEITMPMPARPGRPERIDYEYERNGVGTLFMMCAPLEGWREVDVRARKTAVDYAGCLRALSDEHFPHAEKIVLVQDNLSTHKPAALYEAFGPQEAHRLKQRFEFHYTPMHASWLNIAECELSALARQCLSRRIGDMPTLTGEVHAWTEERNGSCTTIDWQFTTADARIKLRKLYPSFHGG